MVTSVAISFGMMFGGSPLIENLFVYPGVGYYLTTAISRRDYPLMARNVSYDNSYGINFWINCRVFKYQTKSKVKGEIIYE